MNLTSTKPTSSKISVFGLLIALSIIGLWAASLAMLLAQNLGKLPLWFLPFAILWQAFLYTGLFITAHDAMHGSLYPQNLKINHYIGAVAVFSYGFFSYSNLLKKHWLHHHHPASDRDPDFHDGKHPHPIRWYFYFIQRYWGWKQFAGVNATLYLTNFILHIPIENLILFWLIPSVISSMQLFYFGTFLPHREPEGGYQHPHRAQTISLPPLLSFIACYHFGYHEEHHEYPHVPWWELPTIHTLYSSLNH